MKRKQHGIDADEAQPSQAEGPDEEAGKGLEPPTPGPAENETIQEGSRSNKGRCRPDNGGIVH